VLIWLLGVKKGEKRPVTAEGSERKKNEEF
jgi:hypothetical protein